MIDMKTYMELIDYRITEGSEWYTNIPNLYSFSFWNGDHDGCSTNFVFSTKDQTVYCVEVCDYKNNRAYRMIDPRLDKDAEAWDDVKYTDLDVDEDFIDKARSIIAGVPYDTRVSVPLELENDELFRLMKMAHERDITLNSMIEQILEVAIQDHQKTQNIMEVLDDAA